MKAGDLDHENANRSEIFRGVGFCCVDLACAFPDGFRRAELFAEQIVSAADRRGREWNGQTRNEPGDLFPPVTTISLTKGAFAMKNKLIITTLVTMLGVAAHAADEATTPTPNPTPMMTSSHDNDLSGRLGVGVLLGEPTGLSVKYFLNETIAVDGGFGWSFHDETDPHLHADLLWHKFDLISVPEGQLPVYVGIGGRAKFRDDDDDRVGFRLPIGISYIFEDLPMDVFAEVAPIIDFTPSTRGGFNIGVGVRWWF